jgi:aspartyl-tRNA synthetase
VTEFVQWNEALEGPTDVNNLLNLQYNKGNLKSSDYIRIERCIIQIQQFVKKDSFESRRKDSDIGWRLVELEEDSMIMENSKDIAMMEGRTLRLAQKLKKRYLELRRKEARIKIQN